MWGEEVAVRDWRYLHSSPSLSSDKTVVLNVLRYWWEALGAASNELKDDAELFAACLKHHDGEGWRALALAGPAIQASKQRILQACAQVSRNHVILHSRKICEDNSLTFVCRIHAL